MTRTAKLLLVPIFLLSSDGDRRLLARGIPLPCPSGCRRYCRFAWRFERERLRVWNYS
jgi:hypothetical protein